MLGTRNPMVALARGYQLQRAYAKIGKARRKTMERAKLAETGIIAGAPMAPSRRTMVYGAQRDGGAMTPAQRRRHNKKLIRDMVRMERIDAAREVAA